MFRISILVGLIFAFLIGLVSCSKYYSYLTLNEVVVLTIMRMFLTFISFFFLSLVIILILRQTIPGVEELISKGSRLDYTIPPTFPAQVSEEKKAEIKKGIEEIKQAEKAMAREAEKAMETETREPSKAGETSMVEQLRALPPELLAQAIRSALVQEK